MAEQINTFDEHLEDTYNFTIEEGKTDSGARGSIIYGTMSAKDVGGGEISISVALKTFKNDESKEDFINEKNFFEYLSHNRELNCDNIVKCYGTAHIDKKEYLVMEDLNKKNFVTFYSLHWDIIELMLKENELDIENNRYDNIKKNIEKNTDYIQIQQIKPTIENEINGLKTFLLNNRIRHNDLCWKNVMINPKNGKMKIIDFGLGVINNEELLEFSTDFERLDGINEEFDKIINNPEKMLMLN